MWSDGQDRRKIGHRGERVGPLRKAEVIPNLVLAIHLSTLKVKKADGRILLRKEKDLDPLMIQRPRTLKELS